MCFYHSSSGQPPASSLGTGFFLLFSSKSRNLGNWEQKDPTPTAAPNIFLKALYTNNSVLHSLGAWPLALAKRLKLVLARCWASWQGRSSFLKIEQTVAPVLVQQEQLSPIEEFYTEKNVSHGKTCLRVLGLSFDLVSNTKTSMKGHRKILLHRDFNCLLWLSASFCSGIFRPL